MSKKFPDTIAGWQNTTAANIPSANIFHPDIRVQLCWADIEDAVERGAIVPSEAHALWALWASSDSPQRVATSQIATASESAEPQRKASNSIFNLFS